MNIRVCTIWLAMLNACVVMSSNSTAAGSGISVDSQPPVPIAVSPVDQFRKLLAMTGEQRLKAMSDKSPAVRERLNSKLAEYLVLSSEDRESRLRATELRWHLLPLLSMSRTNRPANLDFIPETIRPLVVERLERWDKLPPTLGRELLDNREAVQFLTQPGAATKEEQEKLLAQMTPARRSELEAGIERINALTETKRRQLFERFSNYLDLTPAERSKMLGTLSEAERRQMEKTLGDFTRLTGSQRRQCLAAFDKFAGMSLADRDQFLKNSEKWSSMSVEERSRWRELVIKVPDWPPLPPAHISFPPGLPSAPPIVKRITPSVVTN